MRPRARSTRSLSTRRAGVVPVCARHQAGNRQADEALNLRAAIREWLGVFLGTCAENALGGGLGRRAAGVPWRQTRRSGRFDLAGFEVDPRSAPRPAVCLRVNGCWAAVPDQRAVNWAGSDLGTCRGDAGDSLRGSGSNGGRMLALPCGSTATGQGGAGLTKRSRGLGR
jgi:hypothetical protein